MLIKRIYTSILFTFAALLSISAAISSGHFADNSVLATGKWIKIAVDSCGIYEIDYDALTTAGFTNPQNVKVWGYGGAKMADGNLSDELPDDLSVTACTHTSDGRLLFYGEADVSVSLNKSKEISVRRNYYDNKGYYFLSDCPAPEIAVLDLPASDTAIDTTTAIDFIENEIYNSGNGGAVYFDEPFKSDRSKEYMLNLEDFAGDADTPARLLFYYAANSYSALKVTPEFPDGIQVLTTNNPGTTPIIHEDKLFSYSCASVDFLPNVGCNQLPLSFRYNSGTTPDAVMLDKIAVIYTRRNVVHKSPVELNIAPHPSDNRTLSLDYSSTDIKVWDITDVSRPVSYAVINNVFTLPPSESYTKLIAFDPTAEYRRPTIIGEIPNQNLHCAEVPDMVIITTPELISAAEDLASIHREADGMTVTVVSQDEIFNEFSSGSRAAMAYKLYLKSLISKVPGKLKHVLLYGNSAWDRSASVSGKTLLCYETDNIEECSSENKNYTSDKYFVMLGDDFNYEKIQFGKMNLAIGRIEITSQSEGLLINNKIRKFIERGCNNTHYADVLLMSDSGDDASHLLDCENKCQLMGSYNKNLRFTKVYTALYPPTKSDLAHGRRKVANSLKEGKGLLVFSGHCTPYGLTGVHILDNASIKETHYDNYPFAVLSTCATFAFDRRTLQVARAMIREENGGAIAIVGSCRSVYMDLNRSISDAIVEQYSIAGPTTTIGEIVQDAHNYNVKAYSDVARATNWMCFNLCGDPALKINVPSKRIVIDTIADKVTRNRTPEVIVPAMSEIKISGHISNADDFNGYVYIKVYDRPRVVLSNDIQSSGKAAEVTLSDFLLAETAAPVTNGMFSVSLRVPESSDNPGYNRVTFNAVSIDGAMSAIGDYPALAISTPTPLNTSGKTIEVSDFRAETIANESREDGLHNVRITATIVDGNALSSSYLPGYQSVIKIDGSKSVTINAGLLTDGLLDIVVNGIDEGSHVCEFHLRNAEGTVFVQEFNFDIAHDEPICELTAKTDYSDTTISFDFSHTLSEPAVTHLIITDDAGHTVRTFRNCKFPFSWDMHDKNGQQVENGRYFATALVRNDFEYSATDKAEFVVFIVKN